MSDKLALVVRCTKTKTIEILNLVLIILFLRSYTFYICLTANRMVWPLIMAAARTYAPYITFPAALVVGFIGYNLEGWISDKNTPFKEEGIKEERFERLGETLHETDCTQVDSLKEKKFVPKTMLHRYSKTETQ